MKNYMFIFFALVVALLVSGCESTPTAEPEFFYEETALEDLENIVPQENIDFIAEMQAIEIKVVSRPHETTKNKNFNAPYVVAVSKNGNPVADFPVTAMFPSSRNNDEIFYSYAELKTDKDGKISFMPQEPACSADDTVTFYPTPINDDFHVVQVAKNAAVTSEWKVKTDYISQQGMIYVFDHDTRGRPSSNSFETLRALRNLGFNIGNSPIGDASYLSRTVADLYKATKSMTGNVFGMLVSGSVKYDEPTKQVDGQYECSLVADITCINMKDGSIIYETEQKKSVRGRTEQDALTKCRDALASDIANSILYKM